MSRQDDFRAFETGNFPEDPAEASRVPWHGDWKSWKPPHKGWYVIGTKKRPQLGQFAGYFNGKVWTTWQGTIDPNVKEDIPQDRSNQILWHHLCTESELRHLGRL